MMSRVEWSCVVGLRGARAGWGNRSTRPSAFYSSTHPGLMVKSFGSRPSAHLGWQNGQPRSTMGSRTLSHIFVRESGRSVINPGRLHIIVATTMQKLEGIRLRTQARDVFCFQVFPEQLGPPKIPLPTCPPTCTDIGSEFPGRLQWRNGGVRAETDLLPFHSCSSTAAKSTQTTRSGRSYDLLVSAYRGFEPAGRSSRRLVCIAHGKTGR